MDRKNEKSLITSALTKLGDEELTAVAGGHGHCHGGPPWLAPKYESTSVSQQNTISGITVFAPGSKGLELNFSQSNSSVVG